MHKKCSGSTGDADDNEDVTVDGNMTRMMTKFLHLGDALSTGGRVQEAAATRIRSGWKTSKDIANTLSKRIVLLKT